MSESSTSKQSETTKRPPPPDPRLAEYVERGIGSEPRPGRERTTGDNRVVKIIKKK